VAELSYPVCPPLEKNPGGIAKIALEKLGRRARRRWLADKGYESSVWGARPLKRRVIRKTRAGSLGPN